MIGVFIPWSRVSAARLAGAAQSFSIWSVRRRWPPVVSCRVGRDEAGHRAARWWLPCVSAEGALRQLGFVERATKRVGAPRGALMDPR